MQELLDSARENRDITIFGMIVAITIITMIILLFRSYGGKGLEKRIMSANDRRRKLREEAQADVTVNH